ncbi:P-loop containing nucleoside triphosphate hydrolase protein [Melanogaster broomeanus]|nr:P-loop containing nucleoside triphosphate hydrolase protein [Melanogaster broomeanus]
MSTAQFLREYKLVVVGGSGVGKSALMVRFLQYTFADDYDPVCVCSGKTLVFSPICALSNYVFIILDAYRKQCVIDDKVALLDVIDTLGQEEYVAINEQDMKTGEGFLLVYSITSRDSFEEISRFHQQILRVKDKDSFPVILVANKCDLEYERQVSKQEGRDLAKHFGCQFIETSARVAINVDDAFNNLVREIRKYDQEQQTGHPVKADSGSGGGGEHGGCCGGCIVV